MARHLTSLGALDAPASNTAIAQPDLTRNPSAAGIGLLVLAKAFSSIHGAHAHEEEMLLAPRACYFLRVT